MAVASTGRSVGLEIDSGVVRAVEIGGSAAKPKLLKMASAPLEDGAVEEGIILNTDAVGASLRELWSSGGIRDRNVILGISNQGVLVRYASIPKVPKDKLANVIRFQAQEQLPVPLESVVLDSIIIGEKKDDEGNIVLEALLVAARHDMLAVFLEALGKARLEPLDIDVSTLALMEVMPPPVFDRTVAVVNVTNGLSNILISSRNQPRMARLVAVKVKDLADQLRCPLGQVIKVLSDPHPEVQGAYNSWFNSLEMETRSSLDYYHNQPNSAEVEAIILNGRGARISGIAARMQEAVGLPVKVVNPFSRFAGSERKTREMGIQAVDFAVCAGLARRGLGGS